ncbi:hypothetical protein E0E50_13430 [Azotobacter chroococcum subsp. isscasi]|uniref:hypothetical protein n=1 Tax=Azotobacter chroococcum TaxID=353 RepID=UPI00103EA7B5|nr:hypothetical protein [Azotobacter chroococcum]TBW09817.1 hypothetical protein E0E50_13430 [Azotobacter chroococcum subsp. isscasi]
MLSKEDWSTAVLADVLGGDSDAALRRLPSGLRLALPSRRLAQDHVVREVLRNVRAWFPNTPVLIDRRRRIGGRVVSSLRPNLQFYNPRRSNEAYIEVDRLQYSGKGSP